MKKNRRVRLVLGISAGILAVLLISAIFYYQYVTQNFVGIEPAVYKHPVTVIAVPTRIRGEDQYLDALVRRDGTIQVWVQPNNPVYDPSYILPVPTTDVKEVDSWYTTRLSSAARIRAQFLRNISERGFKNVQVIAVPNPLLTAMILTIDQRTLTFLENIDWVSQISPARYPIILSTPSPMPDSAK